jgi:hypothetical protein
MEYPIDPNEVASIMFFEEVDDSFPSGDIDLGNDSDDDELPAGWHWGASAPEGAEGTNGAEEPKTKIARAADLAVRATGADPEDVDLREVGLKAILFLVSVVIHSALSKSVSAKLLKPKKGLKAANLVRRRNLAAMLKRAALNAEQAKFIEKSIDTSDAVADKIPEDASSDALNAATAELIAANEGDQTPEQAMAAAKGIGDLARTVIDAIPSAEPDEEQSEGEQL